LRIGWGIGREGRKNFIPIKPNSSDASGIDKIITEIKEVLKRQSEYTFKYKKE
jgi:hypothetical protein